MAMKSTANTYGWVAMTLHWASALLIIGLIGSGLTSTSLPVEAKPDVLRVHVPVGTLVLVLTLFRIVWWWVLDRKPQPVEGSGGAQAFAARAVHLLFYVAIVALAGSGLALIALSGAGDVLRGGEGVLPDLWQFPPRVAHRVFAFSLIVLLVFHVGAALWHHFVRRDATLMRMVGRG